MTRTRIGVLGFGSLGRYLCEHIVANRDAHNSSTDGLELAFVWNRSVDKFRGTPTTVPESLWLSGPDLGAAFVEWERSHGPVDLIAEVCHPRVIEDEIERLLHHADVLVGSPTAFANSKLEAAVRDLLADPAQRHGCYLPSGALWGVDDIVKMQRMGTLERLSVTMKKHPSSFKLHEPLHSRLVSYASDTAENEPFLIYDGPVRELCPLAPNNVNTMACAAMAGPGFDATHARLVADKSLNAHIVGIDVEGSDGFSVTTQRNNPAADGAVTGSATYNSFLSSLQRAGGKGRGLFFC